MEYPKYIFKMLRLLNSINEMSQKPVLPVPKTHVKSRIIWCFILLGDGVDSIVDLIMKARV